MARCEDCIHNKVCKEVNALKCRKDFIWYDAEYGCPYYTVDVVPKSEVEELAKEVDRLSQCVLYNDAFNADKIREIFEEIVQEINDALQSNYQVLPQIEESESLWNRVHGKIDALRGIRYFIDELQKKYTEENEA